MQRARLSFSVPVLSSGSVLLWLALLTALSLQAEARRNGIAGKQL